MACLSTDNCGPQIDCPEVVSEDGRSDHRVPEYVFVKVLEKDVPEEVQAERQQADGPPAMRSCKHSPMRFFFAPSHDNSS